MRHNWFDDAQALLIGTLVVALGVHLYLTAGLLTGGTSGIAFLIQYAAPVNFGTAFFVINLPFYYLAWRRMGWGFTLKTFAAVSLLSVFTELMPHVLSINNLNPIYAAVIGGLLIGLGMLLLFRHKASLGGLNILVLYLQDRFGWSAGKVQMGVDCLIVLSALFVVDWQQVLLSILGAVALNLVPAVNHKPGRYAGVSWG